MCFKLTKNLVEELVRIPDEIRLTGNNKLVNNPEVLRWEIVKNVFQNRAA